MCTTRGLPFNAYVYQQTQDYEIDRGGPIKLNGGGAMKLIGGSYEIDGGGGMKFIWVRMKSIQGRGL